MKIKDCPFCGGKNVESIGGNPPVYVVCHGCEAEGPADSDATGAIEGWNALRGRGVPEMREALKELVIQIAVLKYRMPAACQYPLSVDHGLQKAEAALAKAVT